MASPWLQGRNYWGARGFFPSSCVRELCLSAYGPRSPYGAILEIPPHALGQARAVIGLSAQMEEELDFREGDVITIVGIPEPGWFEGELRGRRGIFPEGFVEILGPLKPTSTANESISSEIHRINGVKDLHPQAEEKSWSNGEELPGPYGVALYQFQALEPGELDFEVGDRIRILGVLEDGWLEGELRGKCGIFPHRFVRLEEDISLPRGKWGSTPKGVGSEAESTHRIGLPAEWEEPGWSLVCPEEKPGHLTVGQEDLFDSDPKQNELLKHQNKACLESLSSDILGLPSLDTAKSVNGVSSISPSSHQPKSQLCSQVGSPESSQSPRTSWEHSEVRTLSEWDEDAHHIPHKNILSEDLANCVDVQRRKPKSRSSSFSGTHEGLDTWPVWRGTRAERPQGILHGESCGDLDSKLTEQLAQFEQSLVSSRHSTPQRDSVSRHFSILDFNSEKDIVRGSVEHIAQRRKVLRPPPPRPSTPASVPLYSLAGHSPKTSPPSQPLPISVRPSRPAPLPPPSSQRRSPAPAKLQLGAKEEQGSTDESGGAPQCPFLLSHIKKLEQELDVYGKTQAELRAMLEQPQDDLGQAETLENLEFCHSKMSSLCQELQELRGE